MFCGFLRQSTATTIQLGPFLDSIDGDTEENGLTIAATAALVSKNGANFAAKHEATALTGTGANAHYDCILDTTDVGTLGSLDVQAHVAGSLFVKQSYMVMPANVWDSLFGTDKLQVHTAEITDGLIVAATLGANAIIAAKIADGAFTSAKFADAFLSAAKIADNAIAAAKIAADAVTKIQANLATSANQTTILARIGAFTGTGINTILGFLKAVMSKAADLTPSDVGGTFNNTTDSLEALQELMHPISPGNGTKTVVLHYEHADGSDVSDADVWVTTTADPEGLTKASGKTDSSGNVTVFLDPGTYYRHMQKDGEVPKLNEQTVVTA